MAENIRGYKYKNLTVFLLSLFFAFFLSRFEGFHIFLLNLDQLGLLGAFVGGDHRCHIAGIGRLFSQLPPLAEATVSMKLNGSG
jgi:hypothetical protein